MYIVPCFMNKPITILFLDKTKLKHTYTCIAQYNIT